MADFVWTEERTELCKKLWLSGESASLCVKALGGGLSRSAVIGKMNRIGAKRAPGIGTLNALAYPKRAAVNRQPVTIRVGSNGVRTYIQPASRPLPATSAEVDSPDAKVWTERAFGQCAFPVSGEGADTWSCCNPTGGETYCLHHAALMYVSTPKLNTHGIEMGGRKSRAKSSISDDILGKWAA